MRLLIVSLVILFGVSCRSTNSAQLSNDGAGNPFCALVDSTNEGVSEQDDFNECLKPLKVRRTSKNQPFMSAGRKVNCVIVKGKQGLPWNCAGTDCANPTTVNLLEEDLMKEAGFSCALTSDVYKACVSWRKNDQTHNVQELLSQHGDSIPGDLIPSWTTATGDGSTGAGDGGTTDGSTGDGSEGGTNCLYSFTL